MTDIEKIDSQRNTNHNFHQKFHNVDNRLCKKIGVFLYASLQYRNIFIEMKGIRFAHISPEQSRGNLHLHIIGERINRIFFNRQIDIFDDEYRYNSDRHSAHKTAERLKSQESISLVQIPVLLNRLRVHK